MPLDTGEMVGERYLAIAGGKDNIGVIVVEME
jgi:hypothetical protein